MRLCVTTSLLVIVASAVAAADDQATITFSGKGNQPIEVRDAQGEITEVIRQRNLSLNVIPADAAAREQAYRERQVERAAELTDERQAEESAAAQQQAEAIKAAEAVAARETPEEDVDTTPRRVRRKTVRGTRYVATEPADESMHTPANTGVQPPPPSSAPPQLRQPKLEQRRP